MLPRRPGRPPIQHFGASLPDQLKFPVQRPPVDLGDPQQPPVQAVRVGREQIDPDGSGVGDQRQGVGGGRQGSFAKPISNTFEQA